MLGFALELKNASILYLATVLKLFLATNSSFWLVLVYRLIQQRLADYAKTILHSQEFDRVWDLQSKDDWLCCGSRLSHLWDRPRSWWIIVSALLSLISMQRGPDKIFEIGYFRGLAYYRLKRISQRLKRSLRCKIEGQVLTSTAKTLYSVDLASSLF